MENNLADTGPAFGDIVARVFITAGLITCAVPALFFLFVSEAELQLILNTVRDYIKSRCMWVRPWIPASVSSNVALTITDNSVTAYRIETHNRYLRLLAFQSGICIMAVLVAIGLIVWMYFGRQTLPILMIRVTYYIGIFCAVDLTFILLICRMPLINGRFIDLAILQRLIELAKSCGAKPKRDAVTGTPLDPEPGTCGG